MISYLRRPFPPRSLSHSPVFLPGVNHRSSSFGFDFTCRCRLDDSVVFPRNASVLVSDSDLVDESLDSAARRLVIVGGRVGGVFVGVTYTYSFGIGTVHVVDIVDEFGLFDDVGRCKHVYVNDVGDSNVGESEREEK